MADNESSAAKSLGAPSFAARILARVL